MLGNGEKSSLKKGGERQNCENANIQGIFLGIVRKIFYFIHLHQFYINSSI